MQLPGLRGLGPRRLAQRSFSDYLEDNMLTYAAALAYQVLFSIFPFIVFLIALLGFLQLSDFFDWLLQQAQLVLPAEAMDRVREVIAEIRDQEQGGVLSFGIVVALWSASAGVRSLMHALNVAYDVEETRPAWKRYPLSIVYTLGLALMLILAAGLMLIGPQAMVWLADQVGLDQVVTTLWNWLRLPVAVLLLIIAVAIVYYVGPNIDQPFRLITPGAVLAVIVWVASSLGFAYYVSHFANYRALYGSLGAAIVLLFFFYLSSAVLLFGAEVNAVIVHHSPEGNERRKPALKADQHVTFERR
jgi:membrane protein